jgi:hypothetical protein
MRRHALLVFVLALFPLSASAQTLGATLTPQQEVPPTTTQGFGNATVTFDAAHQNITVTITVANLGASITGFHIHEAPAGTNGGIKVDLAGLGGTFSNGTMTGTFPIAADVAQRMLANPNGFYVNVHTSASPGGAIRGQLAFVSGGPQLYAAELRPTNEVPPIAASTAFGSSLVTIDPFNSTIAWEVDTSGIANATLSHIHRNVAGASGPVVINFATNATQIAGGRASGFAPISAQQANAFLPTDLTALSNASTANGYYVNVHSSLAPGGEIRGQLVPANEYDVAVAGHITNGLGQSYVTDLRVFNPSYTTATTALIEYFVSAGIGFNANANSAMVVSLPARSTASLDDIIGTMNIPQSLGAIRVTSAVPLVVTSRTFADMRASGKGTFGQFVPSVARANALRRGVMPQLSNSASTTSGLRTNIGFFNPNNSNAGVRLELRDNFGALVGQSTVILGALTHQQNSIAQYFPGIDLSNAGNLTLSFDAAAPILAYAAVNDNVSGDSSYVAAQPDSGLAANSQ